MVLKTSMASLPMTVSSVATRVALGFELILSFWLQFRNLRTSVWTSSSFTKRFLRSSLAFRWWEAQLHRHIGCRFFVFNWWLLYFFGISSFRWVDRTFILSGCDFFWLVLRSSVSICVEFKPSSVQNFAKSLAKVPLFVLLLTPCNILAERCRWNWINTG